MTLTDILNNHIYLFILILIRYIGLFLMAPFLGSTVILSRVKIGLAFLLAIVTIPLLIDTRLSMPGSVLQILIDLIVELGIGFGLGFISYLPFAAIQLAGRFVDLGMGFAIVNVSDPINGVTMPMVGQFKNLLAILIFLAINGHHTLIKALYGSFRLIPPGGKVLSISSSGMEYIFRASGDLFILAFKIALPVIATIFIADIIFGFLSRTIPQLNIFILGLPVKIILSFVVLMFSLYFTILFFNELFQDMSLDLFRLIRLFSR